MLRYCVDACPDGATFGNEDGNIVTVIYLVIADNIASGTHCGDNFIAHLNLLARNIIHANDG